jgi:hypothetical protein
MKHETGHLGVREVIMAEHALRGVRPPVPRHGGSPLPRRTAPPTVSAAQRLTFELIAETQIDWQPH